MQNSGQLHFNNPNGIKQSHWHNLNRQQELEKKLRKKGKERLSTPEQNQQKLNKIAQTSNQFEYSIKTHMPFDLFPDDLIIDIQKITFIDNSMLSSDTLSMPIRDINKVEVTNAILFSTIEIVNGSQTTTIHVGWLKKDEARQAQAIIQGLMISYKNDIDLSGIDPNEILNKAQTLGTPVI